MAWTSSSCCCCFSVRMGVMILGFCGLLNLLSEITDFVPIRLAANAVASIAFILMVSDDTESKRKLFFYSYVASSTVMYCFGLYMAFDKIGDEAPWKKACDDIQKKGELKNLNAANLEECHETIKNIVHTMVTLIFIFFAVVQLHFWSVVYTHWKNHAKDHSEDETLERR